MNLHRLAGRVSGLAFAALVAASLWGASCGGGGGGDCNVAEQTGCDTGLVCRNDPAGGTGCFCNPATNTGCDGDAICEEITDGTTGCFDTKVVARGTVFDCADETAVIDGARVVAMDVNGSPVSLVATTDAEGNYELTVPTRRNPDGTPAGDDFTLRTDAAAFQTFPSGVRQAIPIDTASPVTEGNLLVIDNSLTDVCLIALEPGFGTASIFGTVELPENNLGALVVAESSPTAGFSAIADREGGYRIFNLPAGTYTVKAYVQGVNHEPATATLTDGEEEEVNLAMNDEATATLNGSVQIVNPGAGDATSVILVVESTFNEAVIRGETPPGLRAPAPGIAPNLSSGDTFTITGIPSGSYAILAAFENDFLVRDPDVCISGTDVLHEDFSAGEIVDSEGFKITGALDVISPGATTPETVTTLTPTFSWKDDSSEQQYLIEVIDSFGNLMGQAEIDSSSGSNPSIVYGSAEWLNDSEGADPNNVTDFANPLESGQYYQFRVVSLKDGCELSRTEDLKGVFFVQ
ncbi:MAG TPA: carboxypeptidase-like regulatory domain-containing protein [bacterium]|nr:carboxypeptidase-like regulatory domain-containing protein [bacterium]